MALALGRSRKEFRMTPTPSKPAKWWNRAPDKPAGEALHVALDGKLFALKFPFKINLENGVLHVMGFGDAVGAYSIELAIDGEHRRLLGEMFASTLPPELDDEVMAVIERLDCFELSNAIGDGDFSLLREAAALLTRLIQRGTD